MPGSRFCGNWFACALLLGATSVSAAATRSYPPSCFADGLPLGQSASDPHAFSLPLTLHGDFNACFINPAAASYPQAQQECKYSETVAIVVWRVACSGGTSATLLEIDRAGSLQGNTNLYPTFPGVWVQQGNHVAFIRLAQDPNTVTTQTFVNSPVYRNSVYTLENYSTAGLIPFNYNQAFTLTVDNNTGQAVQFDLPVYDPSAYAASQTMPVSGFLTGSWYDPAHGGEGMLTQVFDNGDGATRTFAATWYTFDATGAPYWLVAQASVAIGATHVDNVPVQFLSGGGFAGNFSAVTRSSWGTMNFSFPDCNTLNFEYASVSGLPAPTPSGGGTREWKRLGSLDNLACD